MAVKPVVTIPSISGNSTHFGLEQIFTNVSIVDDSNIIKVVSDAMPAFLTNQKQIMELQKIFSGNQVILYRVPTENEPVNERVNLNLFPALATAWVGLILGEKTDYVFNGKEDEKAKRDDMGVILKSIRNNNDVLLDKDTLYDLFIAGVSYNYAGGRKNKLNPTHLANIPVETCFVIKSRDIGYPVVATVIVGKTADDKEQLTVYTDTKKYIMVDNTGGKEKYKLVFNQMHFQPSNPIQEVRLNPQYLSMVAQGEASQNALNMAVSESINDTIFQMRSLLFITGAEINAEQAQLAKTHGILSVNTADGRNITADYLTKPLDETITSLRTMLFDTLYFIMGIPSQGGTSGNTGASVVASGMQTMDLIAYSIQLEMRKAKQAMLDNIIKTLRVNKLITSDISAIDIDIAFDRQLVMNIVEAADAFSKLKASGFPDRDNLKVTKLSSDVDRVAMEMEKKAKEAILNALTVAKATTTDPEDKTQSDSTTQPSNGTPDNGGTTE